MWVSIKHGNENARSANAVAEKGYRRNGSKMFLD
jgi:hypothetical protein